MLGFFLLDIGFFSHGILAVFEPQLYTEEVMLARDIRINRVYNILRGKMKGYGRNVQLPTNTDPKKTYSWRYLDTFLKKVEQLNIHDDYIPDILDVLLIHAKRNKLLNRGFAILNKIDISELVLQRFERDEDWRLGKKRRIFSSHEFLLKQQRDSNKNMIELLSHKRTPDAYMNMTCWYEQGFLGIEYIVISKACRKVLSTMKPNERAIYPGTIDTMKQKFLILSDQQLSGKLQTLLHSDMTTE